jgi:GxxExxY protein
LLAHETADGADDAEANHWPTTAIPGSLGAGLMDEDVLKRDPRTYAIIGAMMEVHSQLGPGFLEAVYQEALAMEFRLRDIPFRREVELPISYKGHRLATVYRADFVCFDGVLVELKAVQELGPIEKAQVIHYLRATGFQVALLATFATESLQFKRLVMNFVGVPESAPSA